MIRVLIVDDQATTRANLERLFAAEADIAVAGWEATADGAVTAANTSGPDVVVVNLDLQTGDGLAIVSSVAQNHPEMLVVAVGLDDDDATMRSVSDAGARSYLLKPFGGEELLAAIRREPGSELVAPAPAPAPAFVPLLATPPPAAPSPAPAPPAYATATRAPAPAAGFMPGAAPVHTVAVVSGKGGVGATTIAASLALIASAEGRLRTALVDLDLQHGDVRRLLRIESSDSVIDLAQAAPIPSSEDLAPRFAEGPGGLLTLTAPPRPRIDVDLTPEFAVALIQALRTSVDFAVLDIPVFVTPASAAVLRNADRIVLVSGMSDPAVRSTQGVLSLFGDLGIAPERVTLVLNRNEANSDLTKAAVEEALGVPVAIQLPYDFVLVSTSVNRGVPFVMQRPDAQVSRKVRELAATFFPLPEVTYAEGQPVAASARPGEVPERRGKRKGLFGFGRSEEPA
jgi:pilus assembly protein CpaE